MRASDLGSEAAAAGQFAFERGEETRAWRGRDGRPRFPSRAAPRPRGSEFRIGERPGGLRMSKIGARRFAERAREPSRFH